MTNKTYQIRLDDGYGKHYVRAYATIAEAVEAARREGRISDDDAEIYVASGVAEDGVRVWTIATDTTGTACTLADLYLTGAIDNPDIDWWDCEWDDKAEIA